MAFRTDDLTIAESFEIAGRAQVVSEHFIAQMQHAMLVNVRQSLEAWLVASSAQNGEFDLPDAAFQNISKH